MRVVAGSAFVGFVLFGLWLIANRTRLDAQGRDRPNTYISAGYRATIALGLAVVSAVVLVVSISRR